MGSPIGPWNDETTSSVNSFENPGYTLGSLDIQ